MKSKIKQQSLLPSLNNPEHNSYRKRLLEAFPDAFQSAIGNIYLKKDNNQTIIMFYSDSSFYNIALQVLAMCVAIVAYNNPTQKHNNSFSEREIKYFKTGLKTFCNKQFTEEDLCVLKDVFYDSNEKWHPFYNVFIESGFNMELFSSVYKKKQS